MKYIDYDKYQGKLKAQTFWVPLLIALPVTGILLAAGLPDLRLWVGSLGQERLEATYRYRFVQTASGNVTQRFFA